MNKPDTKFLTFSLFAVTLLVLGAFSIGNNRANSAQLQLAQVSGGVSCEVGYNEDSCGNLKDLGCIWKPAFKCLSLPGDTSGQCPSLKNQADCEAMEGENKEDLCEIELGQCVSSSPSCNSKADVGKIWNESISGDQNNDGDKKDTFDCFCEESAIAGANCFWKPLFFIPPGPLINLSFTQDSADYYEYCIKTTDGGSVKDRCWEKLTAPPFVIDPIDPSELGAGHYIWQVCAVRKAEGTIKPERKCSTEERFNIIRKEVTPPKDTDNDGVPDNKDKCPTKAGPADNNGCPEKPEKRGLGKSISSFFSKIFNAFARIFQIRLEVKILDIPDDFLAPYSPGVEMFGRTSSDLTQKTAQSFEFNAMRSITKAKIMLKEVGIPSDDIIVSIQSNGNNEPSGVVLASSSLNNQELGQAGLNDASFTQMSFEFNNPPALSADTRYWLVVERSGGFDSTAYYELRNYQDIYPKGGQSNFKKCQNVDMWLPAGISCADVSIVGGVIYVTTTTITGGIGELGGVGISVTSTVGSIKSETDIDLELYSKLKRPKKEQLPER